MAETWPESLPDLPQHSSYNMNRQSGVIRDSDHNGFVERRRRFTATSQYHNVDVIMTRTELLIFLDFFNLSVAHGTKTFTYTNPMYQLGDITCRFVNQDSPYTINYDADTLDYVVSFALEELPGTIKTVDYPEYKVTSEDEDKVTSEDENKITDK